MRLSGALMQSALAAFAAASICRPSHARRPQTAARIAGACQSGGKGADNVGPADHADQHGIAAALMADRTKIVVDLDQS
jgi:hypothetical protein